MDDKIVVLNRLQTDTIFPLNSSRTPPQYNKEGPSSASPSTSKQLDLDDNVNGKWGTFRYPEPNEASNSFVSSEKHKIKYIVL